MLKQKLSAWVNSPAGKEAIHRKMDKMERKLESYAGLLFGEPMIITYVPENKLKGVILAIKEGKEAHGRQQDDTE